MSFHFSLATVLRIRGILEEREESMLQTILFEISHALEALARIDAEIAASDALRRRNVFKPFTGHHLHASYGELKELMQSKKELEAQIEKLEELRDRQLMVYEEARRNREMLTDMR